MDEQNVECLASGVLFSHNKDWNTDNITLRKDDRHKRLYAEWVHLYEMSREEILNKETQLIRSWSGIEKGAISSNCLRGVTRLLWVMKCSRIFDEL